MFRIGAVVSAVDPHLETLPRQLPGVELVANHDVKFGDYDAVLVLTDHDAIDYEAARNDAKCILDTRHRVPAGDNVEHL